jgi:hypothetical protein
MQYTRDPRRAAKIVVVGTHADALKSPVERDAAWAKLGPVLAASGSGNVTATVSVSCTTGAGFKELQAAILRAIELGGFGSQMVPRSYLQVWEQLAKSRLDSPRIDLASFCAKLPALKEIQVTAACRFLMDAGLCFFDPELQLVVSNLQWLADIFKEVVSFYSGVKDGVVTLAGLRHNAWKDAPVSEIKHHMALLEKFQMAFPRLQDESWVIPSMLKEEPASIELRGSDQAIRRHERRYELDLMPSGGVGRLMVRLQSHPAIKVVDMWRHGMLVESLDGSQVASVVLEQDSSIQLRVRSFVLTEAAALPHFLIQLVTDECAAMLNAMYSRSANKPFCEYVVCPHCLRGAGDGATQKLLKERCVQLVVANEQWYVCGADLVPVSDLRIDVAFGDVALLDETDMQVDAQPFAAGANGVVFKARMNGSVVVVKELSPDKAEQFRANSTRPAIATAPTSTASDKQDEHRDSLRSEDRKQHHRGEEEKTHK